MFLQIFLKPLLLSLILSSSLIETNSISIHDCQGKCGNTNTNANANKPSSFTMFVFAPVLVSTWIFWNSLHEKKLENHRAKLFNRNGGNLLKKKLSKRKKSANNIQIYTAEEMKNGTNNFSDKNVMEKCKPGVFYRGNLSGNKVIVVKIQTVPRSKVEEFVDELIFLSVPHRNLVKIIGCCLETSSPLLAYELHGDGNQTLLDHIHHDSRFSAAAGAARGLAYLQTNNPKFHGNFCGGNILLDDAFHAKLYYTAASTFDEGRDCIDSGGLDEKSDVYSFGILLVEMLTRGAERPDDRSLAASWFVSLVEEDKLSEFCVGDGEEVKKIALMAAKCLSLRSEERPSIKQLEASLNLARTVTK